MKPDVKPTLCASCSSIPWEFFIKHEFSYVHKPSLGALVESVENGCELCSALFWSLDLRINRPNLFSEHVIRIRRRFSYRFPDAAIVLHSETSPDGGIICVECPNTDGFPGYSSVPVMQFTLDSQINRRDIQDLRGASNASPEVTAMVRGWIDNCITHHYKCKEHASHSASFPTDLIDVQPQDGLTDLRLVSRATLESHVRYLTLSHCWGANVEEWRGMMTTYGNIRDRRRSIPFEHLPKSFRDAINLTRSLNERYLWIDALCIPQDDRKGLQNESSMMDLIYSGSLCTISASAATSATKGIFTDRSHVPGSLVLPEASGLRSGNVTLHPLHPKFFSLLESEKTSTRGWCLQERQLSPRIVHYTAFQVLWECKETYKVSEINPIGDEIPSLHRDEYLDHPPRVPHNLLYSIWNGAVLYEEYPPPTNIDFLRPKYIYFALPELKAPRCHDLFKGLYLAREPKEDTIGDWYGQYQKEVNVVGTLRARMIDDYCSWYRLVEEVSQKQFTHSTDHTPEDTACLHRRRDARDTQCRSNPVVSMESDGRGPSRHAKCFRATPARFGGRAAR
ncbi:heterokaryon incompatibility protein-domain-containing protein [Astrocystis sublimbata]|nr:heterokaryon incompatibility protein-domain-containing protein [Astrocystis sublimbata]